MDLKIQDISGLLGVSEHEVRRLIREDRIPFHKIGQQFRFNRAEISDWIVINNIPVSGKILNFSISRKPVRLTELIHQGGVIRDVAGETVAEVLKNAVGGMATPPDVDREALVAALLQRENLMPTAIGNGIAVPHPRNPLIADVEEESVTLCIPKKRTPCHALDGLPIHTFFIVLSATPKRHLEILSKIAYLCQQEAFVRLLDSGASEESIIEFIAACERKWLTDDGDADA